jgi:hypothetical protein
MHPVRNAVLFYLRMTDTRRQRYNPSNLSSLKNGLNTLLIRITTDSEILFQMVVVLSKKAFHALSWMTTAQTVPNIAMNQGMSIVKGHGEK